MGFIWFPAFTSHINFGRCEIGCYTMYGKRATGQKNQNCLNNQNSKKPRKNCSHRNMLEALNFHMPSEKIWFLNTLYLQPSNSTKDHQRALKNSWQQLKKWRMLLSSIIICANCKKISTLKKYASIECTQSSH